MIYIETFYQACEGLGVGRAAWLWERGSPLMLEKFKQRFQAGKIAPFLRRYRDQSSEPILVLVIAPQAQQI
jgi:hypothetical protein